MKRRNPVAQHLRVNRPQIVKAKKGRGSYSKASRWKCRHD